jgi:hypothetical protein
MEKELLTKEEIKKKRELKQKRRENLEKCSKNAQKHVNCIRLNIHNSEEHEFAKVVAWWFIRNGVPSNKIQNFFSDKKTSKIYHEFTKSVRQFWHKHGKIYDYDWERPQILTEARLK